MMSDINCIHNKNCGHEVCTLTCPDFETERDLAGDLELVRRARIGEELDFDFDSEEYMYYVNALIDFRHDSLDITEHAIKRALKAEALVNELRSDSKTDDAVMEGQAKRIEELETLVRDLVEASNEARALIATLTASYSCSNHTRAIYDVMDKTALVLIKAREALER